MHSGNWEIWEIRTIILGILGILGILAILANSINRSRKEQKKQQEIIALMPPEERQKYLAEKAEKEARLESYEAEKEARLERQQSSITESIGYRNLQREYGGINTAMVCPHCQSIGKIRTKEVKQKKGVSGGKATAAVLTGGLSLLAVGLSRKEGATQAHCDNCHNTWFF